MLMIFFTFANDKEEELFNTIYTSNRYRDAMYKRAYKITNDKYLAEDAVQETYIILIKHISKIDSAYSKRTISYIMTILKNVSLSIVKSQNNKNIKHYDELSKKEIEYIVLKNEDVLSKDDNFFIETLKNLDSELSNLFILKYVYGYSLKEISRTTHLSEKNIGVRIHRGKTKMKKFFSLKEWRIHD